MQSNKKDKEQHVKTAKQQIFTYKQFTSTIEQNPFHDQSLFFDKKNLFNIIHPPRKINTIYEKIIISNRNDPLHPSSYSSYRRYQSLKSRRGTNNKGSLIQDKYCPLTKRFAIDNYQAINSKVQYTNRSIIFDEDRTQINKKQFFKNLLMKFRQNVDNESTSNYHQKISLFKKIFQHYKIKPQQKQHFTMLFQQMQQRQALELKADKKISSKITLASRRLNQTSQQHRSIQSPQSKVRATEMRKNPLSQMIKIQSQRKRQLTQRKENQTDQLKVVEESQIDNNKHKAKIVVCSQNKYRTIDKRMHPLMQPIIIKTQTPVDIKLHKFREFLFAVNYGNHLFVQLDVDKYPSTFKVFIGKGNNSNLIRDILKKRFWFQITKDIKQANFVWTQIKQDSVFKSQTSKYYILPQEETRSEVKQSCQEETIACRSVILNDVQNPEIQTKSAQIIVIDKQISFGLKGRQKLKIKKQPQKHLTIDNEPNIQSSDITDPKSISIQQKCLKLKKYSPIINLKTLKSIENPLSRILPLREIGPLQSLVNPSSFRSKPIPFKQRKALIMSSPNGSYISDQDKQKMIVHNHLPVNGILGNKKAMFYILEEYMRLIGAHLFDIVPLTFHIKAGLKDQHYHRFLEAYEHRRKRKISNYWVIKPGEFSNRGNGIQCTNKLQQIKKRVQTCINIKQIDSSKTSPRKTLNRISKSVILQSYITNPLLYNGRKFDIRTYMMTTIVNGKMKAYWYEEGYIRTSSYNWTLADIQDRQIHLTNDAVQKYADSYGKYEPGNKLSYRDIQRYLQATQKVSKNMFFDKIVPQMTQIAAECIKASYLFLDSDKLENNFQIFGLDFMLDSKLKPWLIEINTNPCLQLGCPLLQRLIPNMLQNAFRLFIDPLFPPPSTFSSNYKYNIAQNAINYNKFGLIFDEDRDGPRIRKIYQNVDLNEILNRIQDVQEDKDLFEEDGDEIQLNNLDN